MPVPKPLPSLPQKLEIFPDLWYSIKQIGPTGRFRLIMLKPIIDELATLKEMFLKAGAYSSYDKDADVLYISFFPGEKATTAVELNDNILLRFNRAEKRAIGLTLMDFSVLVQITDLGPRSFPLTGLNELEPE